MHERSAKKLSQAYHHHPSTSRFLLSPQFSGDQQAWKSLFFVLFVPPQFVRLPSPPSPEYLLPRVGYTLRFDLETYEGLKM